MLQNTLKKNIWKDHYFHKAKKESFPARSVYKLQEIQRKYRIIKKGARIIDLGCFPGSWLLYVAELAGNKGKIVGIDIKPVTVKIPSHVRVFRTDILSDAMNDDTQLQQIFKNGFNVVLSDMGPDTTGNKNVDNTKSYNLCQAALQIANKTLMPGGAFVCKIFQGDDFTKFLGAVKSSFRQSRIFKPQSSRKSSREIYIIGLGKK